ncbi:MAG TPA: hypothetical protein VFG41_09805 [Sphingomicrobium sp.]|nr:hypothetical protein [Sphingomicrobium sp.]
MTATASAAVARAPGSTSRGAISIRITIPPHVAVDSLAGGGSGTVSRDTDRLCVSAIGYRNYHVALFRADRAGDMPPIGKDSAFISPGAAKGSSCMPTGAQRAIAANLDDRAGQPPEPLTLLIVAD